MKGKTYLPGEVYEVHTPYNSGIYKVISVNGDTVTYKAATAYLGGTDFKIGSNFSDRSDLIPDIDALRDDIIDRLNEIQIPAALTKATT